MISNRAYSAPQCLVLQLSLLAALAAACEEGKQRPADGGLSGPLGMSALKAASNSTNVLSFIVTWKTNLPATSTVEFGKGGSLTHRIRNSILTTDHKVLIIGLHERTAYTWRALSDAGSGERVAAATAIYTTKALPAYIPYGKVTVHDPRRAFMGWTLLSVNACERNGLIITWDPDFPPTAVMYDMEGRPVWYNAHRLGRIGDVRFIGDRILAQSMGDILEKMPAAMEVDLAGKVLWRGPNQPFLQVDGSYHHHFEKSPGGTYLSVISRQIDKTVGDVVVELDSSHKKIWTWKGFEHLRPDVSLDDSSFGVYAWTHINALVMDSANDWVLINARNISAIFKLRKSSGEVLWALGKGRDFAGDPEAKYPWFQMPHALEKLPNGNLIMLDNGKQERGFARALEYAIDEDARTTRIVWQYRGGEDDRFFSNYWGDADRLPNGNTLISVGTWKTGASSRYFEVTKEGTRVWELQLPPRKTTGTSIGAYNAQRLTPPLIERISP